MWLSFDVTFLFPLVIISQRIDISGILHPLDNLKLGDEIDVAVISQHVSDPVGKDSIEPLVDFQPSSVYVQTERSSVVIVMSGRSWNILVKKYDQQQY